MGNDERERDQRPADRADQARSKAPGLGSFAGPVVGEPARLLRLLLDEREGLLDEPSEEALGGVGTGELLAGGSQTVCKDDETGMVMRAWMT